MQGQALKRKESPQDRAWSAMTLLNWSIERDERYGQVENDDTVQMGLDVMASALVDWFALDLGAARLDEVLAALGEDDDLVETTARLIDLLGRARYGGGLDDEQVDQAERLREEVVEALEELLHQLEKGGSDA